MSSWVENGTNLYQSIASKYFPPGFHLDVQHKEVSLIYSQLGRIYQQSLHRAGIK